MLFRDILNTIEELNQKYIRMHTNQIEARAS